MNIFQLIPWSKRAPQKSLRRNEEDRESSGGKQRSGEDKIRSTSWREEKEEGGWAEGAGSESLTNIEVVLGLPAVLQVVDERVADLTLQSNS